MNYTKLIVGFLVLVAIAGGYFFPKVYRVVGSAVGTTFATAKVAAVNFSPTSATASSTFILNTDGSDRYILDSFAMCTAIGTSFTAYTGAGLTSAAVVFQMSTSSATTAGNIANTNYASNLAIATSTGAVNLVASSTEGVIFGYSRIWPSNTYLGIFANATNTAVCNVGVHYLAS